MAKKPTKAEVEQALRDYVDSEPMPTPEKMRQDIERRQKEQK